MATNIDLKNVNIQVSKNPNVPTIEIFTADLPAMCSLLNQGESGRIVNDGMEFTTNDSAVFPITSNAGGK